MGGALAAASFAALTQILTLDKFSPALSFAVLVFAVSIPLDVFIFITPTLRKWERPFPWSKLLYGLVMILFTPVSLVGFMAVFWHFSPCHAATFLVSSLLFYSLFVWIGRDLRKGRG